MNALIALLRPQINPVLSTWARYSGNSKIDSAPIVLLEFHTTYIFDLSVVHFHVISRKILCGKPDLHIRVLSIGIYVEA